MKHIFRATNNKPTHVRASDSVQGVLHAHADTVNVRPLSALVDPSDFTLLPVAPPPVFIPQEIANWRARAVLEIAGLLATVETALDALPGNAGIVARAAWNSGAPFVRNGPTVVALSAALSLTSEQVDNLFLQAAALSV